MEMPKNTIAYFMTKGTVSVSPEMSLLEAAQLMYQNSFTGLPVVDTSKKVIGIMTEYDLLTKGSAIHLPTFLKLINQFDVYRKDKSLIQDDIKKILSLRVSDVMNKDPLTLQANTSVEETAKTFAEHHKVNPILIVDKDGRLAGVVSRSDIIKFYAGVSPAHIAHLRGTPESTDRAVRDFLSDFERNFVAVSRYRTKYWLLMSVGFLIIGIIATTIFILRVDINF